MLTVSINFKLYIPAKNQEEVSKKLDELNILVSRKEYFDGSIYLPPSVIADGPIEKCIMTCKGSRENVKKLEEILEAVLWAASIYY